jgi:hypothetical protein
MVIATNIVGKKLKKERYDRWESVFSSENDHQVGETDQLKASIV